MALFLFLFSEESRRKRENKEKSRKGEQQRQTHKQENVIRPLPPVKRILIQLTMLQLNIYLVISSFPSVVPRNKV